MGVIDNFEHVRSICKVGMGMEACRLSVSGDVPARMEMREADDGANAD